MSQLLSNSAPFLIALATGAVLFVVWLATRKRVAAQTVGRAQADAKRLRHEAERDAETRRKEVVFAAKEEAHELLRTTEDQTRKRQEEITALEKHSVDQAHSLSDRQATADRAEQDLQTREHNVGQRETDLKTQTERYAKLVAEQRRELQRVSGMTADEAKEILLHQLESDARHDAAHLVKRLEHEARESAAEKAKQIITQAIQRSAAEHAIETTVSVVDLPSDDLKGRIIGREGRNIRALEVATGVELIVDDTPGAIILSSFDPYRREIAKQAIEQLIADGRIHPARIEKVIGKVKAEVDEATLKEGEATAFELELHDLHPEIYRMMGRLKYRTSCGQNVLAHSKEVAYLAGVMAREVGLDAHVSIPSRLRARHREGDGPRAARDASRDWDRVSPPAWRERCRRRRHGCPPHGHRLAVARGDDRAGGRRDLSRTARGSPGYSRVAHQAFGETGGDRRLVQGRVEGVRSAGRPRDPDHGRERANLRRGNGVAVEGHRQADRERAQVPGPNQGDGHSRNPCDRLREVARSTWASARHACRAQVRSMNSNADSHLTVGELGEHALIERLSSAAPPAPPSVPVGIGDDAAVVEPERGTLTVITTDALVDGVHFDRTFTTAEDIGHKALAVNLSDLAAMGATPRHALLSLALPETLLVSDFDALVRGVLALASRHRATLIGGNITRSNGPLFVDVTAAGSVKRRRVLTRDSARGR